MRHRCQYKNLSHPTAGLISEQAARAVVNETISLGIDDFCLLDGQIAPLLVAMTARQARDATTRAVIRIDAEAARVRAVRTRTDQRPRPLRKIPQIKELPAGTPTATPTKPSPGPPPVLPKKKHRSPGLLHDYWLPLVRTNGIPGALRAPGRSTKVMPNKTPPSHTRSSSRTHGHGLRVSAG